MKITLNSSRGCRAVVLICFLVAMVIIIGGLGIYVICKMCKKLDAINGGGGQGTNNPPYTNSPVSLTIQKSANQCEWTNFAYVTGFLDSVSFHLTVLDANTNVITNYSVPLSVSMAMTNQIEDHDPATPTAFYRMVGTNADAP